MTTTTIAHRRPSCRTNRMPRFSSFVDRTSDPLGFEAGDANVYRYVGNSSTNATDPSGLQEVRGRKHWEDQARKLLGPPREVRNFAEISEMLLQRNRIITAAYAEMFLSNPDVFRWAGMAAYASYSVGTGMNLCQGAIVDTNGIVAFGKLLTGAPTEVETFEFLANGNLAVFKDIYWQHLAYRHGGFAEIQGIFDAGDLPKRLYDAWKKIDDGTKSGNADLVWQGNKELLEYEQLVTLQKQIYAKHRKAAKFIGALTRSPIPGDHEKGRFSKYNPNGDLGNPKDRWDWISNSMLPAYRRLVEGDLDRVKRDMCHLRDDPIKR